jgi:hypothetical protein
MSGGSFESLKIPRPIHFELYFIGTSGLGTNFHGFRRSDICIKQNGNELVEVGEVIMKPLYENEFTMELGAGAIALDSFGELRIGLRSLAVRLESMRVVQVRKSKNVTEDEKKEYLRELKCYSKLMDHPREISVVSLDNMYAQFNGDVKFVTNLECCCTGCDFHVDFVSVFSGGNTVVVRVNIGRHNHMMTEDGHVKYSDGLFFHHKLLLYDAIRLGNVSRNKKQSVQSREILNQYCSYHSITPCQLKNFLYTVFKKGEAPTSHSLTIDEANELMNRNIRAYDGKQGDILISEYEIVQDSMILDDGYLGPSTTIFLCTEYAIELLQKALFWFVDFTATTKKGYHCAILTLLDGKNRIFPSSYYLCPKENIHLTRCFFIKVLKAFQKRYPGKKLPLRMIMFDGAPGNANLIRNLLKEFGNMFDHIVIYRGSCGWHLDRCVDRYLPNVRISGTLPKKLIEKIVKIISSSPASFVVGNLLVSCMNFCMGVEGEYKINPENMYAFFEYFSKHYVYNNDRSLFYVGAAQEVLGGQAHLMGARTNNASESSNSGLKRDMMDIDINNKSVFDLSLQVVTEHLNKKMPKLGDYQDRIVFDQKTYDEFSICKMGRVKYRTDNEITVMLTQFARYFLVSKRSGNFRIVSPSIHKHVFDFCWTGMLLLLENFYFVVLPVNVTPADEESWMKSSCTCKIRRSQPYCPHTLLICDSGDSHSRIFDIATEKKLKVKFESTSQVILPTPEITEIWTTLNEACGKKFDLGLHKGKHPFLADEYFFNILGISDIECLSGNALKHAIECLKKDVSVKVAIPSMGAVFGALKEAVELSKRNGFQMDVFNLVPDFFSMGVDSDKSLHVINIDDQVMKAEEDPDETPHSFFGNYDRVMLAQIKQESVVVASKINHESVAPRIKQELELPSVRHMNRKNYSILCQSPALIGETEPLGPPGKDGNNERRYSESSSQKKRKISTKVSELVEEFPEEFAEIKIPYNKFLNSSGCLCLHRFSEIMTTLCGTGNSTKYRLAAFLRMFNLPELAADGNRLLASLPIFNRGSFAILANQGDIREDMKKIARGIATAKGASCLSKYYAVLMDPNISNDDKLAIFSFADIPNSLVPNFNFDAFDDLLLTDQSVINLF